MNLLQSFAQQQYKKENRIRTDEEVAEFYQKIEDPFQLKAKLALMGFHWQDESSFFDWNKTPAESLASKTRQLNCGDFMMFYVSLYKKLDIEYSCYLLKSANILFWKRKWQHVSIFKWNNETWMQTRNMLTKIENKDILSFASKYSQIIHQP